MHPAVAFHDRLASSWESKYQGHSFAARRTALDRCVQSLDLSSMCWLDAGCGTGTLSRWLAAKGCQVRGVDASAQMVEAARRAAQGSGLEGKMTFDCIGSLEQLPDADASYDGILCSSVIEYLDHPPDVLHEFARVLKPGGVLVVSIPNSQSWLRGALVALFHTTRLLLRRPWPAYLQFSRNRYTQAGFEKLLLRANLSVRKNFPFGGPLPSPLDGLPNGGSLLMFVAIKI